MEKPEQLSRRALIAGGLGALAAGAARADAPAAPFFLRGKFLQSGYCVGQADPRSEFFVDGVSRGLTSAAGWFYAGLDRDAPRACRIEATVKGARAPVTLDVAPQTYDVQRVDGLPPQTVTPTDPDVLARIARDTALKNAAFLSRADLDAFRGGFAWPLDTFVVSGHFGNQRVLNGTPKSPHMGFDMAAPAGTPIHAPQAGLVVLAEPDLFFEGGLVLVDHGQGLISMYLHQSRVIARKGEMLKPGQPIGEVGQKGRATGPHLCWRLKWLDRHMDPSLMVG